MEYSKEEKKVLKKLDISDFRHMTKDKVMTFVSMLPNMDPEVAKKALEQFPEFVNLSKAIVCSYKDSVEKIYEGNTESQREFYLACNTIIESLKLELEKENIDDEERNRIIDQMVTVAGMIGEKDRENKKFYLELGGMLFAALSTIALGAIAILGGNSKKVSQS